MPKFGTERKKDLIIKTLIVLLVLSVGFSIYLFFQKKSEKNKSNNSSTSSQAMANMASMAGMVNGDPSKRYTVSFTTTPAVVEPNQDVQLKFKIYDAATGNEVTNYWVVMTKFMHLVIVDSELQYFDHIHPTQNGSEFTVTTRFPKADVYHLYINYQPAGANEQQIGFTLPVGGSTQNAGSTVPVDSNLTNTVNGLRITLSTADNSAFSASAMNNMAQLLNFHFVDDKTGQPVSDLQPYLGAGGHLVMINEKTYKYLHVHPAVSSTDNPDVIGPDVKFLPMPLFDTIDAGVYRVFAQFSRNNQVFVVDFTINVK
jgi:hypothetical protein